MRLGLVMSRSDLLLRDGALCSSGWWTVPFSSGSTVALMDWIGELDR